MSKFNVVRVMDLVKSIGEDKVKELLADYAFSLRTMCCDYIRSRITLRTMTGSRVGQRECIS